MNTVLQTLSESAQKRADNWQTFFVRQFPDVEKFDEIVMLGAHSYALINTRRRIVKDKIKIEPGVLETPSAIARDYVRYIYKQGPRATKAQLENVEGIPPVPSYARPGKFAHGFYIDIAAAYWSIMGVVGWNVDYNPGLWLSPGRPPKDFPFPEHKVARNCIVSAGRMSGIPRYDPRKLPGDPYDEIIRGSELRNNQLPRLIHDILNSIAELAIEAGAVYVNNDGFIAPTPTIAQRVTGIITDWGLSSRVKAEGGGQVKASGTYEVGISRTLNYESVVDPSPIANIYPPPYRKWLQAEFSFFAAVGNDL